MNNLYTPGTHITTAIRTALDITDPAVTIVVLTHPADAVTDTCDYTGAPAVAEVRVYTTNGDYLASRIAADQAATAIADLTDCVDVDLIEIAADYSWTDQLTRIAA